MLPRGTHDYTKFIKPSELAALCRRAGLEIQNVTGMTYNPLSKIYALGPDSSVNYIVHCVKG
jgi:2-polyprenyl-6-hydroxyphenyl methylase/3-demethylubiquinone-9 3-methyltransferase